MENGFKEGLNLWSKPPTMKKEALAQLFIERLSQWEESQKGQTSGYIYEKSYLDAMKEIEKEIFKELVESKEVELKKK